MIIFATQKLKSLHIFCLQNKAFDLSRLWSRVLLTILITTWPAVLSAQELFTSEDIAIRISESFEKAKNEAAILVLRHKTQGYPSFNAVLTSGPWPYLMSPNDVQGQKLVDDYRLVGLKNAKLTESSSTELDSRPALHAELSYSIGEKRYYSEVWIISLLDRYITLTAVYKDKFEEQSRNEIRDLVKTIKINEKLANTTRQDSAASSAINPILKICLGISFAFILGILLSRWRARKY